VLSVRGALDTALAAVKSVTGVAKSEATIGEEDVHVVRATWDPTLDEAATLRAAEDVVATLVRAGCAVREAKPMRGSLEEVFAELTR
jgi:hypothetical protein